MWSGGKFWRGEQAGRTQTPGVRDPNFWVSLIIQNCNGFPSSSPKTLYYNWTKSYFLEKTSPRSNQRFYFKLPCWERKSVEQGAEGAIHHIYSFLREPVSGEMYNSLNFWEYFHGPLRIVPLSLLVNLISKGTNWQKDKMCYWVKSYNYLRLVHIFTLHNGCEHNNAGWEILRKYGNTFKSCMDKSIFNIPINQPWLPHWADFNFCS